MVFLGDSKWLSPLKRSVGRTVRQVTGVPWSALESIWVALWVSFALATVELSCVGCLEGPHSESGLG